MKRWTALVLVACNSGQSEPCMDGFVRGADGNCEPEEISVSLESLDARVQSLEEQVSELLTEKAQCPDEMVLVGDFCIDRYKASVWSEQQCDGTQYGTESDDYPTSFPDSGDWVQGLFSCSMENVIPAGEITWFQAAQACALSGKRLCSNVEWQTAAAGIPAEASACGLLEDGPSVTGSFPDCVSAWGTVDQVGIRWEWTADWSVGGSTWMFENQGDDGDQLPWPTEYGDGEDYTLNVNGETMGANGTFQKGLPAAVIRGGDYGNAETGGHFALSIARGPSHSAPFIGFRCCKSP